MTLQHPMTWLDVACGVLLVLIATGGYVQGFIRGLLRLLALSAGCILGFLFVQRLQTLTTLRTTLFWAAAAAGLGELVAMLIAWSISRSIPGSIHRSLPNRLLGIVPALVPGIVVMALALGLVARLAETQALPALIHRGALTGPLASAIDLAEQALISLR